VGRKNSFFFSLGRSPWPSELCRPTPAARPGPGFCSGPFDGFDNQGPGFFFHNPIHILVLFFLVSTPEICWSPEVNSGFVMGRKCARRTDRGFATLVSFGRRTCAISTWQGLRRSISVITGQEGRYRKSSDLAPHC